jgi:hypothetical protein
MIMRLTDYSQLLGVGSEIRKIFYVISLISGEIRMKDILRRSSGKSKLIQEMVIMEK